MKWIPIRQRMTAAQRTASTLRWLRYRFNNAKGERNGNAA